MENNGLTLSSTKTEACVFTKKRKIHIPNTLSTNNMTIEINRRTRFLGLLLETKLNWKFHLEYIENKCHKYLNIMKMICNKHWGMNPTIALTYYKATIRATLDFGSIFYSDSCKGKLSTLDKVQNRALRLAMGYLNSTPIDNIIVECKEKPSSTRLYQSVNRFVLKAISSQKDLAVKLNNMAVTHLTSRHCKTKTMPPMIDSFCKLSHLYGRDLATSTKPFIYNCDYTIGKMILQEGILKEYRSYPERLQDSVLQSEIARSYQNATVIYTDASKMNEEVGAAWYCPSYNSHACIKLHPATSVYTAEMIGILKALEYSVNLENNKILILSDCKSAIQKLTSTCLNQNPSHLQIEILKTQQKLLNRNKDVKIAWIKGHVGIKGNQEADRLAKYASLHGESTHIKLCVTDVKCYIENKNQDELKTFMDSSNRKGLFYKNLFVHISKKPWFSERFLSSRRFIVFINRLRVNHNICKAYLHKINIEQNNKCLVCNEKEDLEQKRF
uniref:ribonuclease H n=1 Tax=Cacopsylla melanoneura TaxID=428564 RepID=A0A8D8Q5N6_9HEMI